MSDPMSRTLIKAGAVVTMDPAIPDLERADVLIDGARIADVAPHVDAQDATIVDASDCVIMPGLIDAHLHTWQTALRGIAGDWTVPNYMQAMHRGLATYYRPEDIYIANLVGALNQINAGCTTLVDWCHNNPTPAHTDAAIDGLEASGIRAVFLHGSPKPNPKSGQRHFSEMPMPRDEVERLRNGRLSSGERLVTLGLALLGPQYSVYEVAEEDLRLARELDLLASVHVGGGSFLSTDGFDRLIAAGLVNRKLNVVHGNNLSDAAMSALTEHGATFTVTADVEMQMGFGNPITGRARALGSPLSIGIDVEPAIGGDLLTALRLTLQVQRNLDIIAAQDRGEGIPETTTITCREALQWATVNGACMIGQEHRLGSLTPGKQADIILIRRDDLNVFPMHDPVRSIVLQANGANVDTVFIAGRMVKQSGRLLYPDLKKRQQELLASGRRILRDIGLTQKVA